MKWQLDPEIPIVWPHRFLENDTLAYALHHSNEQRLGPRELSAECWLDHPTSSRYFIMEDSIKISPDTVLTLLWWEDEGQLLEIMESDDE